MSCPNKQWTAYSTDRGSDGVEERDGHRPRLHRKDLTDGQISRAGSRGRKEEAHGQHRDEDDNAACLAIKESSKTHRHRRGTQVGQRDHRFSADGVEQSSEQQGPCEVAQRPHHEEQRHGSRRDTVELAEQGAEIERECVVEKRLPDEQRQAEDGAFGIAGEGDAWRFRRRRSSCADESSVSPLGSGSGLPCLLLHLARSISLHYPLGLILAAVDEQPARAFRDVAADQEYGQSEHRADAEGQPPADVLRERSRCSTAGVRRPRRPQRPASTTR